MGLHTEDSPGTSELLIKLLHTPSLPPELVVLSRRQGSLLSNTASRGLFAVVHTQEADSHNELQP